jgi:hypothetical protein
MRKKMLMLATALGILAWSFAGLTPSASACPNHCREDRATCRFACSGDRECIVFCDTVYIACCGF